MKRLALLLPLLALAAASALAEAPSTEFSSCSNIQPTV